MFFVILGSFINFCDVFLVGGILRINYFEVGFFYIYFNFIFDGDKMIVFFFGDVLCGVLFDCYLIFFGG